MRHVALKLTSCVLATSRAWRARATSDFSALRRRVWSSSWQRENAPARYPARPFTVQYVSPRHKHPRPLEKLLLTEPLAKVSPTPERHVDFFRCRLQAGDLPFVNRLARSAHTRTQTHTRRVTLHSLQAHCQGSPNSWGKPCSRWSAGERG